jgi:hypothetical protein
MFGQLGVEIVVDLPLLTAFDPGLVQVHGQAAQRNGVVLLSEAQRFSRQLLVELAEHIVGVRVPGIGIQGLFQKLLHRFGLEKGIKNALGLAPASDVGGLPVVAQMITRISLDGFVGQGFSLLEQL